MLVMSAAAVAGMLYFMNRYRLGHLLQTSAGFSLLAISYAGLTMAALSPQSLLGRLRVPGATSLALWSYAIYLMHKPVFVLLSKELCQRYIDTHAPLTGVRACSADSCCFATSRCCSCNCGPAEWLT